MGADNEPHFAWAGPAHAAPIPPRELIERTGGRRPEQSDESFIREFYEQAGRERRSAIIEALPDDYSFERRRVLDFGCGSGRVLRQFLPEAASGEFWGCDLHGPTIAWLDEHLTPPLHFHVNDRIPTPHPDGYFDLVYAISVFTHITHEWSAWLLELHRILKPDGLLLATIVGPEAWGRTLSSPPDEDGLGMCVQQLGQRPGDNSSGARVLHSPWWLRLHWGRAFEVLSLRPGGFGGGFGVGWHGFVLGRKKGVSLTRDDLERPEPEDPRELEAQRQQLVILEEEAVAMREGSERQRARSAKLTEALERCKAERLRLMQSREASPRRN
ncbi:MAG: class I SAM-dependent methyltransferase, partial [Actinomycetota bacterium]